MPRGGRSIYLWNFYRTRQHNEFSSSNVRMQSCEAQGTALAADLNAVKAGTGSLTDPLNKQSQHGQHAGNDTMP